MRKQAGAPHEVPEVELNVSWFAEGRVEIDDVVPSAHRRFQFRLRETGEPVQTGRTDYSARKRVVGWIALQ